MPIFERLAYHSLKRSDPTSQVGSASSSFPAPGARTTADPAKEEASSSSDGTTAASVHDSEGAIIGSLEAREDNRALNLLDGPFTWQMAHVSGIVIGCDFNADVRRTNRYQSSPQPLWP
jgi:hypothetical protein